MWHIGSSILTVAKNSFYRINILSEFFNKVDCRDIIKPTLFDEKVVIGVAYHSADVIFMWNFYEKSPQVSEIIKSTQFL